MCQFVINLTSSCYSVKSVLKSNALSDGLSHVMHNSVWKSVSLTQVLAALINSIAASNPGQGMDDCPRTSLTCCSVQAEALRRGGSSAQGVLRNV